jgi:beta-lactamase class D
MRTTLASKLGFMLCLGCSWVAGCEKPRPAHETSKLAARTSAAPAAPAEAAPSALHAMQLRAEVEPRLAAILRGHQLQGTIALLERDAAAARCSDPEACSLPLTPASTFKIPNSLIGLETGVIPDAEYVIPWDGVNRWAKAWNHDHSLRTALRDSVVWYYQELARRVGKDRMRDWLARLEYGNMQMGDAVDRFWLDGPLTISPLQQVEFLRRLVRAQLPISERSRGIVLDITKRGELDGKPLHGKTGWARPGEPTEIGWFVGWVEDASRPRYVAVALGPVPKGVDMMTIRQAVAEEALRLTFD